MGSVVQQKLVSLPRFCGSSLPPDLTSSGPVMTVLFVADEGVADSGFCATYQAITLSESTFYWRAFPNVYIIPLNWKHLIRQS